jgi:hypothetical protein
MSTIKRKPVSDLLGYKWGRLEVVDYLGLGKHNKHYWGCVCECGGRVTLATYRITGKDPTLSCGCLRKEVLSTNRNDPTKHGLHKHKLYAVFHAMHYRCSNENAQRWKYYGGKGIKVCYEWANFPRFYKWAMSSGYKEGLSIDRVDPDSNYCPSNCRWITVSENTRRSNRARDT